LVKAMIYAYNRLLLGKVALFTVRRPALFKASLYQRKEPDNNCSLIEELTRPALLSFAGDLQVLLRLF